MQGRRGERLAELWPFRRRRADDGGEAGVPSPLGDPRPGGRGGGVLLLRVLLAPADRQRLLAPAGELPVVHPAALTLPVLFSGFAFSTELKRAPSVGVALSSNLLGAMPGGFRSLYVLAFAMYAVAFVGSLRTRSQVAPGLASAPSSA